MIEASRLSNVGAVESSTKRRVIPVPTVPSAPWAAALGGAAAAAGRAGASFSLLLPRQDPMGLRKGSVRRNSVELWNYLMQLERAS